MLRFACFLLRILLYLLLFFYVAKYEFASAFGVPLKINGTESVTSVAYIGMEVVYG